MRRSAASIFEMSLRCRSRVGGSIPTSASLGARAGGSDLRGRRALPVGGAKLDTPIGLAGCAVGEVRLANGAALELRHGSFGLAKDLVFPVKQLLPEIGELRRVHELFV